MGHYIGRNSTFDMTGYTVSDQVSFTQSIQSDEDTGSDSFFYVDFKFINGQCHNATLSLDFEETVTISDLFMYYAIESYAFNVHRGYLRCVCHRKVRNSHTMRRF